MLCFKTFPFLEGGRNAAGLASPFQKGRERDRRTNDTSALLISLLMRISQHDFTQAHTFVATSIFFSLRQEYRSFSHQRHCLVHGIQSSNNAARRSLATCVPIHLTSVYPRYCHLNCRPCMVEIHAATLRDHSSLGARAVLTAPTTRHRRPWAEAFFPVNVSRASRTR